MRQFLKTAVSTLAVSCLAVSCASPEPEIATNASAPASEQWTQLFNGKDLTGWDVYLGPKRDAEGEKIPGTATGLNNDPEQVYTVAEVDGTPAIRISGVIGGGISTVNSYENYHLRMQMKWGTGNPWNRERPDSGLLYHAGGEHGADADYWLRSFEYQIMPDAYGDLITIEGCVADVPSAAVKSEDGEDEDYVYDPNGQMRPFSRVAEMTEFGGSVDRLPSFNDPASDWVTLELYTVGQTAIHLVDGQVVLAVYNTRLHENGTTNPLTSGKIQIQSEGSEVFYRNIELRPITELPAGLANLPTMASAE